jgi:hypothetical protein
MFELTNQELEMVSGGLTIIKEAIAEASSSVVLTQGNYVVNVGHGNTIIPSNEGSVTAISIATAIVY